MDVEWIDVAEVMQLCFRQLHADWQIGLPPYDSLPTPALEQVVDEWCAILAQDPAAPLSPPAVVRPWILARLAVWSAFAQTCASEPDAPASPEHLNAESFRELLVVDWNAYLHNRWTMMMTLEVDSFLRDEGE